MKLNHMQVINSSEIKKELVKLLEKLGVTDVDPKVELSSEPTHGDYTSNVAMVLAGKLKRKPIEIAEEIKNKLTVGSGQWADSFEKIEAVPPGFINFHLSASFLSNNLERVIEENKISSQAAVGSEQNYQKLQLSTNIDHSKKKIMVEFAHPNTHKAFHIGHLRNITTGESIVRLLEAVGHKVIRVNYQGDVGMHIAKALYALLQISKFKDQISKIKEQKDIHIRVDFLGKAYAAGSAAYEESEEAKQAIGKLNKQIYAKDPEVYDLYQMTRQWSLDYFESIYKRVGSHFNRYYFESEVYESGKKLVLEALQKGIFESSEGAVIFPGKKYGLHNRVFITSEGNPTYEGKDMGLGQLQFQEHDPDLIVHVVGPEQAEYFKVIFEALDQIFPQFKNKEKHLMYGWVKLKHGKMSSRSGNVVLGEWLIDEVKKEVRSIIQKSRQEGPKDISMIEKNIDEIAEKTAIAAVKYSFLKVGLSQEIAFDIGESISFEGDSGPYLLYTYARTRSVLRKAEKSAVSSGQLTDIQMEQEERLVLRQLYKFEESVFEAARQYSPNSIAKYLYDLARYFNVFYNKHSILGSVKRQASSVKNQNENTSQFRIALTHATSEVLKKGLYLLGIETVESM